MRSKKIAITVMTMTCIVALLFSFSIPVSAYSGLSGEVYINQSAYSDTIVFGTGESFSYLVNALNTKTWSELLGNSRFPGSLGEYDYPYVYYTATADNFSAYNAFSYACIDTPIPSIALTGESIQHFYLNYASDFQFFMVNSICEYIRFSVRTYTDNTIGALVSSTDMFEISPSSTFATETNYLTEYNLSLPAVLEFFNSVPILNVDLVLCIDVLFVPGPVTFDRLGVGISQNTVFNYTRSWGQGIVSDNEIYIPTYPELYNPMYLNINTEHFENALQVEAELLTNYKPASESLADTVISFVSEFSNFHTVLLRITDIFSYSTSSIPRLNSLVIVSLALGLLAFIFGLSKSTFGASDRPVKDDSSKHSRSGSSGRIYKTTFDIDDSTELSVRKE